MMSDFAAGTIGACIGLITMAIVGLVKRRSKTCDWMKGPYDDYWGSSCNNAFWFEAGCPDDNDFKFCPYCGNRLVDGR